jgi:hypothetical protein
MREKPDHLGICHKDGCGELAKWKARLVLRGSPLRGRTTVWVCDQHQRDAKEYILNDQNRDRLVDLLVENNFADLETARGHIKHNADVEFFDPFDEAA